LQLTYFHSLCSITLHFVYILHFLYPFLGWWVPRLIP
jgi:hypothetical protein